MNRLIEDLLDVSCIEAGQLSIEQRRVRTDQVVTEALDGQRTMASAGDLELQLELVQKCPTCGRIAIASSRCSKTSSATP